MMSVKNVTACSALRFVIGRNQQVGVAPGRLSQGPDNVQPPHSKRPCDGDRLEGVCWEVSFAGVKLAPLAGVHDLAGISNRGGPIEALAECVVHKGARRRVVAAHARVNVSKELAPLRNGYAPLKTPDAVHLYSSPSTRVNDLAILVMRLAPDRSVGSSPRSIQAMYLSRQSSAWGTSSVSISRAPASVSGLHDYRSARSAVGGSLPPPMSPRCSSAGR
jgi:hypothetical protein